MKPDPADTPRDKLDRTADLVGRARTDPEEFGRLYERIAPALFAWCQLRVHPRLHAHMDAQDLQQEVWFRAMKNLKAYDPKRASFRAWLFGIAKYTLLESIRRLRELNQQAGAQGGTDASKLGLALDQCPANVTSITERLTRDDTLRAFLERAREFPNEDRLILVYCGLEGRTCRDAADRLGLSEAAVIKRWQRVRRELRDRGWAEKLLDPSA